jgi:glyoxylate/hydroxypyruvate/2-ketogluconate reductase
MKVLVTREIFDETIAYLAQTFQVTGNRQDALWSVDELAHRLQGMDGVQTSSSDKIDAALLARCPGLRAVCNTAVGYNNIDVAACTERGILVTNTPGVLTDSVADYSMAMILATCRRMIEGEKYLRDGEWKITFLKQMLGQDVHHSTLGIIGFGRIGQAIARRARGFDMNIQYHSRTRASTEVESKFGVRYASKDELLRTSDIVLLILPYTTETHHYIGTKELSSMKSSAVLVNMARGGIVDDAALIEALKARTIWAAGLDVYENEPRFKPEFLQLDNVVLSPHIASATEATRRAMSDTAARNLVAALTTGDAPNLLNPDALKKARPRNN